MTRISKLLHNLLNFLDVSFFHAYWEVLHVQDVYVELNATQIEVKLSRRLWYFVLTRYQMYY